MAKKEPPPVLHAKSHPRVDLAPDQRSLKARSVGRKTELPSQYQAPGLYISSD